MHDSPFALWFILLCSSSGLESPVLHKYTSKVNYWFRDNYLRQGMCHPTEVDICNAWPFPEKLINESQADVEKAFPLQTGKKSQCFPSAQPNMPILDVCCACDIYPYGLGICSCACHRNMLWIWLPKCTCCTTAWDTHLRVFDVHVWCVSAIM